MIKSWLILVAILFVTAKTLLWVKGFILPIPISILGGAFLAIASNYDRGIISLFRQNTTDNRGALSQTASIIENVPSFKSQQVLPGNHNKQTSEN